MKFQESPKSKEKKLNLGCGSRYIDDWTNIDFISHSNEVIEFNLLKGIPFNDNSFELVYHSHILEHFTRENAIKFIEECYRVLQKGGILRIVVPDLEQITKLYLESLEKVRLSPSQYNQANYNWMLFEMYDQITRNKPGGEMATYWEQESLVNDDFIRQRMGGEFISFRAFHESIKPLSVNNIKKKSFKNYFNLSKYRILLASILLKEPNLEYLLNLARFRTRGEIHQWMYDSYSLSLLLKNTGFKDIKIVTAFDSSIKDWGKWQWLDIEEGKVRKPDSLFIEAKKS